MCVGWTHFCRTHRLRETDSSSIKRQHTCSSEVPNKSPLILVAAVHHEQPSISRCRGKRKGTAVTGKGGERLLLFHGGSRWSCLSHHTWDQSPSVLQSSKPFSRMLCLRIDSSEAVHVTTSLLLPPVFMCPARGGEKLSAVVRLCGGRHTKRTHKAQGKNKKLMRVVLAKLLFFSSRVWVNIIHMIHPLACSSDHFLRRGCTQRAIRRRNALLLLKHRSSREDNRFCRSFLCVSNQHLPACPRQQASRRPQVVLILASFLLQRKFSTHAAVSRCPAPGFIANLEEQ